MPIEIKVPELGESIVEATVGRWLKHAGDVVKVGEPLVELETDKVNLEVGAERDGILLTIDRQQGQDVKIGDVLGVIDDSVTLPMSITAAAVPPSTTKAAPPPAAAPQSAAQPATPVAQRAAAALGVDIQQVPSSGSRVTKTDVEKFAEQANKPAPSRAEPIPTVSQAAPAIAPVPPAPAAHGGTVSYDPISYRKEERIKMSRRRRTIAQRLVEAQHTAAMLTTFNEIDMTAAMNYRTTHQETFQKQHGVKLGFMSFFVKASIAALKQFPRLNAELQGDEMLLKQYYDIGVAIGAEDGLVVPVLRNADALSFADIERKIKAYSAQVEANALALEDLRGGTFTITNGGVFGSMMSTPILNAPQVAILGMHKIEKRPVVVDDQIVIRPMMYVALSYDHRIVDGRESVQFLVRIKELLENIDALLLS